MLATTASASLQAFPWLSQLSMAIRVATMAVPAQRAWPAEYQTTTDSITVESPSIAIAISPAAWLRVTRTTRCRIASSERDERQVRSDAQRSGEVGEPPAALTRAKVQIRNSGTT